MKKLAILLSIALSIPSFGVSTVHVALGTNNLAATYSTSFPQLTLSGLYYKAHLAIINGAASAICCDTETPSATVAPTAADGHELCAPASSFMVYDNINILKNVYCRSISGTLSSGTLDVQTW